tara:strand:+ start:18960 stop:20042 length:1083 start_codon:yes stop_codon:yes gene_type:complete
MKIDFLINSLTGGGAERVMSTLANGFSQKSKNIKLITFNDDEAYNISSNVTKVKLHKSKIKNHTIRSFVSLLRFYVKKKNRPDVLISFMPKTNLVAILVGNFYRIKVIISEHTNHKADNIGETKWIRELFYRYANCTTVLTKFDVPYYKAHGANVSVMPNPIILPEKVLEYRSRQKNILIAGSLNRYTQKGFDSLLYILSPLLHANPEWTLTIAGEGEYGEGVLKNLVKDLNLTQKVVFPGFCENIENLMQNSQIYILCSQYEGLPMGLMEALSNGMACISYNCVSGPSELIENEKNGLLVENQNAKAMQDGLKRLILDGTLREKLASNAHSSVHKFSLENILNKWLLLISNIIENGKYK